MASTIDTGSFVSGALARMAKEHGVWISAGGIQEKSQEDGKWYNCHVIIDARGSIRDVYRKIHLFDVDIPGGPRLMESNFTLPGNDVKVCDSPAGKLGLSICYDLRFPDLYQKLRFDKGAQVILVPSAFTVETGRAHWEVLLRARAIETQCYVIAAAQVGAHNEKRSSYGHSLVIDPWGAVAARIDDESPAIATAEIDFSMIDQVRARMPLDQHRKRGLQIF